VVLVGLPDLGSVCAATHLPSYVEQHAALTKVGVDDVFYVTVNEAPALASWSAKVATKKIKGLADPHGFFTRALGLEAAVDSGQSHRYDDDDDGVSTAPPLCVPQVLSAGG
jgi:peroxiredoxin